MQPKLFCYIIVLCLMCQSAWAQVYKVSGRVYDKTKATPVLKARVQTNTGNETLTDSSGYYTITLKAGDSLWFYYAGKPTMKYGLDQIPNPQQFNISLGVTLPKDPTVLKEVVVVSKSHYQDSVENREMYAKVFNYQKPGLSTDLNQLIGLVRIRHTRNMKALQNRILLQEQEKYINSRYTPRLVGTLTGLSGKELEDFMKAYRPTYAIASSLSDLEFGQLIQLMYKDYQYNKQ